MAYAMAPRTCVIHPALRPWRPGYGRDTALKSGLPASASPVGLSSGGTGVPRRFAPVRRDRYRDGLTPDVRRGLSRVSYP